MKTNNRSPYLFHRWTTLTLSSARATVYFVLDDDSGFEAAPVEELDDVQVLQGYVERSTVDPIQTMTNMMMALRAYETNQRVVQMYDQTLDKAVNEIGRV